MTYSTAQKNEAATLLIQALPGMHYRVARAWVTAEQGGNNNPLGLSDSNGVLYRYPSLRLGIAATARHIKTSPLYRAIYLSTKGGTHRIQATAICRSPWRLGQAGLKLVCGQDPYYTRIIFYQLRLVPPPNPCDDRMRDEVRD